MRRSALILAALCALVASFTSSAQTPGLVSLVDESLNYDIYYKWGFINKLAGHATMSLVNDGDLYEASVTARNAEWANSIFLVRDTLYSTMQRATLAPVLYTFLSHENNRYKKEVVKFSEVGDVFYGDCYRESRKKPGLPLTTSTLQLEAEGPTVDMLSSFYYIRSIDFGTMTPGQQVILNIFSATKKERLAITYLGTGSVNANGVDTDTYNISFTFTRNGVESSAPINAWLSLDDRRIPLKIEGSLPVGKVRAFFTGENQAW